MKQLPSSNEKYQIIRDKNTYYFSNIDFEEEYEGNITQLSELLVSLKRLIDTHDLKKELLADFIQQHSQGLKALLILTGLSKENLLRLITFVRLANDSTLNHALKREDWADQTFNKEWTEKQIIKLSKTNRAFAECLAALFLEGATYDVLKRTLPLFELQKLRASKFSFNINDLIDTMVRYNVRGAYKANKLNNPELWLAALLEERGYEFEKGQVPNITRKMDFIIPNINRPQVIVESSYVVTTSSSMGDKARAEVAVSEQIRRYYSYATFVGFVDGIGWLARPHDLKNMLSAFDNVFTFAPEELNRFIEFLDDLFGR